MHTSSDVHRVIQQKVDALTAHIEYKPVGSNFHSSFPSLFCRTSSVTFANVSSRDNFIRYVTFPVKNETRFGILFDNKWGGSELMTSWFQINHYPLWKRIVVAIIGVRMSHYFNMIEVDKNNPYDYKRFDIENHQYL